MNFDSSLCFFVFVFISDLSDFLKRLNDFSQKNNVVIQGFDARKIADAEHLSFSVYRAKQAFLNQTNEAKDIGLEVLRFSSGQKKIDKAFSMGLIQGENRSVFILFGETDAALQTAKKAFLEEFETPEIPEPIPGEKKPFLMKQFDITKKELEVVGENKINDLVMERVALVDITR